jgi:glycosyltransferase involved in cell wall biosynthesis
MSDTWCPDVFHCDSLFLSYLVPSTTARAVIAPHNHESLLYERLADLTTQGNRRLLYRREARALAAVERSLHKSFEMCIAVSDEEAAGFRRLGLRTRMVANGVEVPPHCRHATRIEQDEPLRLLFVGSQSYEPNRRGFEWFQREVLPVLRERIDVIVDVVGGGGVARASECVRVHGTVPDVGDYYADAHVAIIPLHAGGGSRLKLLEALAYGVPVVTTSIGKEGLDVRHGRDVLVGDEADEFARQVTRIAESYRGDLDMVRYLQRNGRTLARRYAWGRVAEALWNAYESLDARPAPRGRGTSRAVA